MPTPLPPEWDSWLEEGARLLAAPPLRRNEQSTLGARDPKFALGDFLVGIPSQYVEALSEALYAAPGQFRVYREVAAKVASTQRVASSWTVHRDLREQPALLRDGLTVRGAAALLGKQPIDAKPDRHLSLEERAANVRAGLADAEVYALIDNELGRNRAERQLRHRARQVQSEHSKRRRELETELRAAREAKSAFEATVKAELELNKAAQIVEAIGQTLDDLPQPERLLEALADLNAVIATVLVEKSTATTNRDGPIIIDGEMWQARPARAALADSNQRDPSGERWTVIDTVD